MLRTGHGAAEDSEPVSGPSTWRPFRRGVAAAAAIVVVGGALLLGPWLSEAEKNLPANLLGVLAQLLSTAWGVRRFRAAPTGPYRRAWLFITLHLAAWSVANCIYFYYDSLTASQPFPSVADAFYVLGIFPVVIGLMFFPAGRALGGYGWRLLLDAAVMGSAVLLASYLLFLEEVVYGLGSGLNAAVLAFYPLSDLAVAGLVGLLILRGTGRRRVDLSLLAAGFVVFAISDVAHGLVTVQGTDTAGDLAGLGYVAAPLLIGLAALCPVPSMSGARERGAEPERIVSSVPDLAVLAALAISAAVGFHDWHDWGLAILTMSLSGIRQLVLSSDNRRLRQGLEERVDARTMELDRLARRHERTLASVGEGIYGVDLEGRISFVNAAAAQLLGRESSELLGRPACEAVHPHTSESHADCVLQTVLSTGAVNTSSSEEYARVDGARFPVEITAAPIHDEEDLTGAVVVFRDISQRQAMDRIKSEFVSVVSHELRTPLTSIRGALEMLADGDLGQLPPAAAKVVDIALNGSERLTRLIGDVLDIERLESGTLPFRFAVQPAEPLVRAAVHSVRSIADDGEVQLVVGEVGGQVRADGDWLVQALTNLLGNAVKFSPVGGRVVISLEEGQDSITFVVSDEGRGIPVDSLDSIFERFQQVAASDAHELGGTGLGLSITKSIVEQHGGRIWVDSAQGVGSAFSFSVPNARGASQEHVPVPLAGR